MVGRISFFVNAGIRFVTEMCKMRAFVELWDEITRERYGIDEPKFRRFRYGVQVNSLGLTEQQPENNVYRILLEMLAVTLSKNARARAVQLPAWNEALGLPRPWDQQWSLRMQQILAYETDLLEYGDLFDGNPAVTRKVEALKDGARAELAQIDGMGGAVAAIEYMKSRLVDSNSERITGIEGGETTVVGVNRWTEGEDSPLTAGDEAIMVADPAAEADQIARLTTWRETRDAGAVEAALAELRTAAASGANIMPASIKAAKGGCDHRRMGRYDSHRVWPVSRPHRRVAQPLEPNRRAGRYPRAGGRGLHQTGPPSEIPGGQTRPGRPLQRRRANRRAGPRLRHGHLV